MAASPSPDVDRAGKRYRLDTPAGAIELSVMRSYPDGTVDVLCTCCGARWERKHLRLSRQPDDDADAVTARSRPCE
jgi:hypothetical protein